DALARLYKAKGRPEKHPVIVHLARYEQVFEWAVDVPACLKVIADKFWPGPITVVLKRASHVLDQVTGGQDTVALRVPSNRVAQLLLTKFSGGLAAPSANRFGRISPTTAHDVEREFANEDVPLILDGGGCDVGIESTIIDLSAGGIRLLRPGMITKDQIESATGMTVELPGASGGDAIAVRVPGSLKAHYAPTTPLVLVALHELSSKIDELRGGGATFSVLSFEPCPADVSQDSWLQVHRSAAEYAQQLYANLRRLDALSTRYILVERPPETEEWRGVRDRLTRAAAR
ncbi:MAG: L-threonylcarbamoyladenylate synthase, partial [Terriglobales bacterium]